MTDQPTDEEVQRVRDAECAAHGHQWTEIEEMGRDVPTEVLCTNCGKSAPVYVDLQNALTVDDGWEVWCPQCEGVGSFPAMTRQVCSICHARPAYRKVRP